MTATATRDLDLADIQGLVLRGHGALPEATFLLLEVRESAAAGTVLADWAGRVTSALERVQDSAIQVALTAEGVRALAGDGVTAGFSQQFTTGMATAYRSRLLGDQGDDGPATWDWGGPTTPTVHVLVLVYAASAAALTQLQTELVAQAEGSGLALAGELATDTLGPNEPFGFHDGISQPLLTGLPGASDPPGAVRSGEFVLGYPNEYGQLTERPLLADSADPERLLPRADGAADLGRNGSYLVLRQLEQHVDAFHEYLADATRRSDGSADPAAAALLGAQLVGRWPSGAPLTLDPQQDNPTHAEANEFGYHANDADGLGCPIGAHVRRANPRDALAPKPGTASSLDVNRRHRILRRGRAYRTQREDGTVEQGLYFLCLNANLARQFEFIQHSWLNDPGFNLLDDASDPLVGVRVGTGRGAGATFSAPATPVRRRYRDLPQFVRVRGGGYFFLPGISALRWLATRAAAGPGAAT
ncbi:Dyp-type peroxidase [Angustibacter luteus]|uniref:Dyp-type peroxidase n=1 Tax=Angustibacter luteus TaxID=658456 RepID=A0ABW1JAT9_9ACTN